METLISGLTLFIAVHLISSVPGLRARLVARVGEGPYKGLFSLVSLTGLYFIVTGKLQSPLIPLWQPPGLNQWLTIGGMFVSLTLVAAAYVPSNVKRLTAHPMLWGVIVWAIAHLLSNGDLAAVILFGGLGVFAIISMVTATAPQTKSNGTINCHWSKDITVIALAAISFTAIAFFHSPQIH